MDQTEIQKIKQDFFEFENETVGMKQELILKRRQVEQLRKDIDAEKIKNHDLNRTVDMQKHEIGETTRNLNLALQNNQLLDCKLQEKIEETNKFKLQLDLLANESKTLRELLHKTELEKYDLLHKVEDLEEQNKRLQMYHKQLNNTDQQIMNFIDEIKREIVAVEAKRENLTDVAKELKLSQQLYEQLVFQKDKIKYLENENQLAEKRINAIEVKYKKLQELLEDHKFLMCDGVEFLQLQYQKCIENHKRETEFFKNCIKDYNKKLMVEKETSNVLIIQNDKNYKIIEELRALKRDVKNVETQTYDLLQ